MLRFVLRQAVTIPLEAETLTPDACLGKSIAEIERLAVYQGNRPGLLGEYFRISGDSADGAIVVEGDCSRVKHLGEKMTQGSIRIEGNAGMHVGAGMTGGSMEITGNASDWLGAEMRGGTIHVHGNAGDCAGSVYRGGSKGMRGGVIRIDGNAGHELGANLRRGLIVVGGRSGDFAGIAMIAGSLFLLGGVGANPGAGMKRGTIAVFNGPVIPPPTFRYDCHYNPVFLRLYLRQFRTWGLPIEPGLEAQMFQRFSGDLLALGKGEIIYR